MMRVADVAEQLKVSNSIVYALIEAGRLACYRIGLGRGAIRVREDDLQAYLESTRSGEATTTPLQQIKAKLKHIDL